MYNQMYEQVIIAYIPIYICIRIMRYYIISKIGICVH